MIETVRRIRIRNEYHTENILTIYYFKSVNNTSKYRKHDSQNEIALFETY